MFRKIREDTPVFRRILVPVDLAHVEGLEKALRTAADLSKLHGIPIVYVGVTDEMPGPVAHNPEEYAEKLAKFAEAQAVRYRIGADTRAIAAHDPAVELDDILLNAVKETGADLVIMGTHVPTFGDYVWPSHGGHLANHAEVSVFLVR